jgi:ring-1,2-phenylacetyl-CoA epoxidase subunit PaaB
MAEQEQHAAEQHRSAEQQHPTQQQHEHQHAQPDPAERPHAAEQHETWPLWEVFIRSSRGLSHVHAGSLHAPDAVMAVRNARDLYTRRGEGVSVWVVPSSAITASDVDARDAFFESAEGKEFRHATYYTASEGVPHL